MAQPNKSKTPKIVASHDLATGLRTIGGLLGQLELVGLDREASIAILQGAGLPASAYDDPSFPVSPRQDFEILNEIRKHLWPEYSMEVALFGVIHLMRIHMFGPLGMAWQTAPTLLEAVKVSITYPQLNWGRTRVVMSASDTAVCIEHELEKIPAPLSSPEEVAATYRYALLLDITGTAAIILDTVSDRSLLQKIRLPFERPDDWSAIEGRLPFKVEFGADTAQTLLKPDFLSQAPKSAHQLSFKLAMQLVEKESAALSEEATMRDAVVRWLWACSPPLKKSEIAKLQGMSERSLTRQLAGEGTSYNDLFAEVQSQRARNLLANSKLSISEVAYRMGYSDPAAFTRAFTLWQGMTPSSWRADQV